MKKSTNHMLAVLAVLWVGGRSAVLAQSNIPPDGPNVPAMAAARSDAVRPAVFKGNATRMAGVAEKGVTVNFRGVPLDDLLNYLTEAAGFNVVREANTQEAGTVDMVSTVPLNQTEIVALLNRVLAGRGLAAMQDGRSLVILSAPEAEHSSLTPVLVWKNEADSIPQDGRLVTELIVLHGLNPTQVIKDLSPLLPSEARVAASEGGNTLVLTARPPDIRRFMQMVQALDSSSAGDLEVYPLEYADAAAIAQELNDVFAAPEANAAQENPFQNISGNAAGGTGGSAGAKRGELHVKLLSDSQDNAVLVSAPLEVMTDISNLIHKLDIRQTDPVQIRVFPLRHSDPTDIVNEISSVFPDPSSQGDAQNNGLGNGPQFVGLTSVSDAGPDLSEHRKRQATVVAVADGRTQSVIVTASKGTMALIENMVATLDRNAAGMMQVYVFRPKNSDVADLESPLSDLFRSTSQSSSSSSFNALTQRASQAAQSGSSMVTGFSTSNGGSSAAKPGQ